MFGKGKKEKDIQKMLEGLTPEEKSDLLEALKGEESEEQKGEETNENSTNESVNQEVANANDEKVNEGAEIPNDTNPATDGEAQPTDAIPVSEVMLKSDFAKYLEQFENRFKNIEEKNAQLENQKAQLENQNKELTDKATALEKENEDLKEKYENNSFGNYGNKSNDDKVNGVAPKESFKEYADKYFK